MAIPFYTRIEAAAVQLAYALPTPVRRIIAGRPIVVDGQELALDAQLLLRLQRIAGTDLVPESVTRSRQILEFSRYVLSGKTIQPIATREIEISYDNVVLPATLYTPEKINRPSGLLVFYHGGGFVLGTRETHDNTARFLAHYAGVQVLSVEYRLAPEHAFPAAPQDALAGFDYAYQHASELGVDADKIAVGGDSAGATLATVTALQCAQRQGPRPAFQLLLYPATDGITRRPSRELFSSGFFLTDQHVSWFSGLYAPNGTNQRDPQLSPLHAQSLAGLPPAYVATAGFDPLRDEGEAYAARLEEEGVPTALSRQADLIHGYVNFLGLGKRFREATAEAAGALRMGLALHS